MTIREALPTTSVTVSAAIIGLLKSISSELSTYHKGDIVKRRKHKKNISVTLDGVGK